MRLENFRDPPQKDEGSIFIETDKQRLVMEPAEARRVYDSLKSLVRRHTRRIFREASDG